MNPPTPTARHLRDRLGALDAERRCAIDAGLAANATYMGDLERDIAAARKAYVMASVVALAEDRIALAGRPHG